MNHIQRIISHLFALLVCIGILTADAKRFTDELSFEEEIKESMNRIHPLKQIEVSWDAIPWKNYSKIIISGPQRSGTTFFASALAARLGFIHFDEDMSKEYRLTNGTTALINGETPIETLLQIDGHAVFQRPRFSHVIHKYPAHHPSLFVAFLSRNCLDVFRSQNRIMKSSSDDRGWTCSFGRTQEWKHYHDDEDLHVFDDEHDMICTIKQQAYLRYQYPLMKKKGINTEAISYKSIHNLRGYVGGLRREKLGPKELLPVGSPVG